MGAGTERRKIDGCKYELGANIVYLNPLVTTLPNTVNKPGASILDFVLKSMYCTTKRRPGLRFISEAHRDHTRGCFDSMRDDSK